MSEPVFRNEYRTVYQVSRLLFFNGQLQAATQGNETEVHFDS
jgi:hypothetical protein